MAKNESNLLIKLNGKVSLRIYEDYLYINKNKIESVNYNNDNLGTTKEIKYHDYWTFILYRDDLGSFGIVKSVPENENQYPIDMEEYEQLDIQPMMLVKIFGTSNAMTLDAGSGDNAKKLISLLNQWYLNIDEFKEKYFSNEKPTITMTDEAEE